MRRIVVFMLLMAWIPAAVALEDGANLCTNGLDDDADGLIDADEDECVSSVQDYGFLPGPIAVGLGEDQEYLEFDVAMTTLGGVTTGTNMMVVDLKGTTVTDVVTGRASSIAVYENLETTGKLSLPRSPAVRTGFLTGTVRYAGGDFSGDSRADLVAVNATTMRRYQGSASGNGTFTASPAITASPGPGGGLPAVVPAASATVPGLVAVANTRLRLYDARCNTAPSGFPTNETFAAGGLCTSIDLPGTATASHIVPATVGTRQFLLVVNASTVSVYEVVFTTFVAQKTLTAVLRSSITLSGITDVVYSTADQLFLFAFANTVQARALTVGTGTASLTTVPALGTFTTSIEAIADITVGEFKPGERSLVFSDEKTEFITVVPFTVNGGWRRNKIVTTTSTKMRSTPPTSPSASSTTTTCSTWPCSTLAPAT